MSLEGLDKGSEPNWDGTISVTTFTGVDSVNIRLPNNNYNLPRVSESPSKTFLFINYNHSINSSTFKPIFDEDTILEDSY